ncbi:MAG: Plastocyanin [Parcubacteria group bacterium Gr01-1014_48]|nr:MAG: Plastocyanin [Parcubacteria group bacterium Greene0416_14]TSC73799.1 MAG: Plastocyanin [Parcubacteria group bacterium Gr01-1014_48]TSD01083.1 MAG: Plastocyanin [Parcubacteria group bacterium Greene1014_15]TSD08054.1 MAG: Plastocyanin [Parcubacteria group bacterium Greene0714_4]
MKKILIILVIIGAIIALFTLTKKTTQAPSDTTALDSTIEGEIPSDGTEAESNTATLPDNSMGETPLTEMTVAYGPKGFDPKSVTIKAGQTVTFVNESESSMWVGSSMHPTHADYPEKTANDCLGSAFDQCEAVGTGGSYSFTFNKKGSWGYHNHVAPNNWGTVVVE